jgi:hypothetical protein
VIQIYLTVDEDVRIDLGLTLDPFGHWIPHQDPPRPNICEQNRRDLESQYGGRVI